MKLIKLKEDHYIIVDDSEIKEGDFCYDPEGDPGHNNIKCIVKCLRTNPDSYWNKYSKKITHSTKPLNTDFSDWFDAQIITLQEVKKLLGEVDAEKKAKESNDNHIKEFKSYPEIRYLHYGKGFISGYNQALEDNKDKKYTLEDLEAAACFGMILEKSKDDKYKLSNDEEWEGFIQSLQQKTEWEVEFIDGKLKLKP